MKTVLCILWLKPLWSMLLISDYVSKTFEVDSNLDLFFVICFCHLYIWLQEKDLKLCMKGQGHCWRSFAYHKTISMWTQELYNLEVFGSLCVIFYFFFENRFLFPFVLISKFPHFVSWYPHHHCDLHCYHISNVFNQYRSR